MRILVPLQLRGCRPHRGNDTSGSGTAGGAIQHAALTPPALSAQLRHTRLGRRSSPGGSGLPESAVGRRREVPAYQNRPSVVAGRFRRTRIGRQCASARLQPCRRSPSAAAGRFRHTKIRRRPSPWGSGVPGSAAGRRGAHPVASRPPPAKSGRDRSVGECCRAFRGRTGRPPHDPTPASTGTAPPPPPPHRSPPAPPPGPAGAPPPRGTCRAARCRRPRAGSRARRPPPRGAPRCR